MNSLDSTKNNNGCKNTTRHEQRYDVQEKRSHIQLKGLPMNLHYYFKTFLFIFS